MSPEVRKHLEMMAATVAAGILASGTDEFDWSTVHNRDALVDRTMRIVMAMKSAVEKSRDA